MRSGPGPSIAFLADSDVSIHQWLSQQGHRLGRHPVLDALSHGRCPPSLVIWAWRRRKSIADTFLVLLSRTQSLAIQEGRTELARAIHVNLSDEAGLDPDSGQPTGRGAHREWARWLIEALEAVEPAGASPLPPAASDRPQWNVMPFDEDDGLALLAGMCMAVEKCIPIEFQAFLHALEAAFPQLGDAGHPRALHYLRDHIEHDERRHLPDLVDGFLGRAPGCDRSALAADLERQSQDLASGVERILTLRLRFYDALLADACLLSAEASGIFPGA